MANDDYAVVAGITKYTAFRELQGPENDACKFHDWLISPEGGNIADPDDRIALILSSRHFNPADDPLRAKPSLEELEYAFDRLIERGLDQGGRLGRRLYIYLAGHGFGPDVEEAALLMANASRRRMHHLPGRSYARWFRMAALFDEIVLFMDCCRDDYPRVPLHVPSWPEQRRPRGADVRYFYGFATKWSRKAREKPVAPGGPVQGLFTRALLAALTHAPPDDQGRVTGAAIEEYVFNYLPELVEEEEYQEPRFEYERRHDIVFVNRRPAVSAGNGASPVDVPVRLTFRPVISGLSVEILKYNFERAAMTVAGAEPWELTLPAGIYLARVLGTDKEIAFDVIGEELIDVQLG